ncbi:unnamed protein product [Prunus brigantina]
MTRETNFNPIEEYRWADDYSGRFSISGDGSSGSRYDGSTVRRVKLERFDNNSSRRFEVIEVAREENFNLIEEYGWANDYSGRHNISGDGSSGSRYDGSAVSSSSPEDFCPLNSKMRRLKKSFFCIDKIAVEAARYVKAQTNWKCKDITFHPNSSRRLEVIEMTREANFNPIEEYRWADDYSGRLSIYDDGSSGSGYDGSAVRRVKSERFDNNRFVSLNSGF